MVEKSNKFSRFWQELKRRKTNRVIVVYAATAFVILQLVEILAPALLLPEWTTTFIIILLAIGFPLSAIFSWFFDITPGGIEKTKPASVKKKHKTEVELRTWKGTTLLSGIVIIGLILFNIIKGSIGSYEINRLEKSIAVLPFDKLSDDEESGWFADAINDEIIEQLVKINRFDVRSRTTVIQYKQTDKTSPEIAKEINVNFLVEGTVQFIDNQFRIRVQLIRAAKDDHIWVDTYVCDTKNYLPVQIEIAKKIANALNMALTPEEIKQIEKEPTTNYNAYSKYISGNKIRDEAWYHLMRGNKYNDSTSFENAIRMYDKAIEYDPLFAMAYARRAITRSWFYYIQGSKEPSIIIKCKEDIDKALEIDPELAEAYIALGFYYYYCNLEYPEALTYFKKASEKNPDNWEPVFYMALVHRRYGNWTTSQSLMTKVLKYNPQDALILTNIGLSYDYMRSYDSALIFHEKAINVIPDWESPYINKIETLVRINGSTEEARNLMNIAILKTGKSFLEIKVLLDIYDGKFNEVLKQTEKIMYKTDFSDRTFFNDRGEKLLLCAMLNRYLNNTEAAEAYFDSTLVYYKSLLTEDPENAFYYSSLGIAYAGLKNRAKAVEAGEKALRLTEDNVLYGTERKKDLAQIYTMLGDFSNALKQIDGLLKNPSCFSLKLMQLDPVWKPLIFLPEFQGLLIKYSKI